MNKQTNKIYQGNTLDILKTFPDNFIDCVMTSPPYWALRSYLKHDDPLKSYELGNESSPSEFVIKLCDVFDEVKRVLKSSGTCWVNLGDTYACSGNGTNDYRTEGSKSLNGVGK